MADTGRRLCPGAGLPSSEGEPVFGAVPGEADLGGKGAFGAEGGASLIFLADSGAGAWEVPGEGVGLRSSSSRAGVSSPGGFSGTPRPDGSEMLYL